MTLEGLGTDDHHPVADLILWGGCSDEQLFFELSECYM